MNSENYISVVIPYYNRHETINESIQSVLMQSLQPNEIIIVDDGSEESSFEFLNKEYADNALIRVIKKKNGGVSSARNMGLIESQGKYVAFLDSDDYWTTCHLENCVDLLTTQKNLIAAHSKFEFVFTGTEVNNHIVNRLASRLLPWITGSCRDLNLAENRYVVKSETARELLTRSVVAFSSSSLVINKESMKSQVFFDVSLPFGEDVDFMTAMSLQGDIGYVDELGSFYRIHGDNTINIGTNLTKDDELHRIEKLRSIEKRIIYSLNPEIKSSLLNKLSERYYLVAQSLSDKKNYKKALGWYLLSFKLNANKASFKHIVVQKLLPDVFAQRLYKE